MELILIQDVENLGFTDDVVNVKPGYGRNFLIPQGMAKIATPSAVKDLNEKLKQRSKKEEKEIAEANALADKIKGLDIKMEAKVGAGNKLFGSITNADLSERLKKEGIDIDRKYIKILGGTVKTTGNQSAVIRLHRTVNVDMPFEVVAAAK